MGYVGRCGACDTWSAALFHPCMRILPCIHSQVTVAIPCMQHRHGAPVPPLLPADGGYRPLPGWLMRELLRYCRDMNTILSDRRSPALRYTPGPVCNIVRQLCSRMCSAWAPVYTPPDSPAPVSHLQPQVLLKCLECIQLRPRLAPGRYRPSVPPER